MILRGHYGITQPSRRVHRLITPWGDDEVMRLNPTKATAVLLIAAAGMVPTLASSVQAQAQTLNPPIVTNLWHAQRVVEREIMARQVQLVLLGTELADAPNVTASDRTALGTVITNEQSALVTDATNAAAATTVSELAAVRQAMLADERVYAVVTGQVGLVIAADNDTVTETGYAALATEISPLVTELNSKRASALLADISSEVTAATGLSSGISADALALTPAGYPGNESQIKSYDFALHQAGRDLNIAKNDVKGIEEIALATNGLHIVKPV
jgi:hypothetical protein